MARKAYLFMHDAGIVSEVDAVNIINDGNIVGVDFTAHDVRNAMKLFGPSYTRSDAVKKLASGLSIVKQALLACKGNNIRIELKGIVVFPKSERKKRCNPPAPTQFDYEEMYL